MAWGRCLNSTLLTHVDSISVVASAQAAPSGNNEWRYQVKTQKMVAVVALYEEPNQTRVVTVWVMRRR